MPFAKGTPKPLGSGRRKGITPAKRVEELSVKQILAEAGHNPIRGMIAIATGNVPCNVCRGKGRTAYQPAKHKDAEAMAAGEKNEPQLATRTCQSCYGSGYEKITPDLRGRMEAELAKYAHPQLRALEISGDLSIQVDVAEILRRRRAERLQPAPEPGVSDQVPQIGPGDVQ